MVMIDKSGIKEEDRMHATRLLNRLRSGGRVFGNPAEGLRKTLKLLEEQASLSDQNGPTSYKLLDQDTRSQISMIKAGINGEEELASYLERLLKHSKELDGLVVFASLNIPSEEDEEKDYIPDSDFVAVYGKHIMILDAKNIPTNPKIPLYLMGNELRNPTKALFDLLSSKYVWEKKLKQNQTPYSSIDGCTVIVNKSGATIMRNQDWYKSAARPIHISELEEFLIEWISKINDSTISLKLLTEISNAQIRKEKTNMDLSDAYRKFGI